MSPTSSVWRVFGVPFGVPFDVRSLGMRGILGQMKQRTITLSYPGETPKIQTNQFVQFSESEDVPGLLTFQCQSITIVTRMYT